MGLPDPRLVKICLIGLPGAGKSTLAQALAKQYALPYWDTDQWIVQHFQTEIATLWQQYGENYIRQQETKALKIILQLPGTGIVATGGGLPCISQNIQYMQQNSYTVFLNTPCYIIAQRLYQTSTLIKRPLFQHCKIQQHYMDTLLTLQQQRLPYYQQAHMTL